jgi:hypothetical protein
MTSCTLWRRIKLIERGISSQQITEDTAKSSLFLGLHEINVSGSSNILNDGSTVTCRDEAGIGSMHGLVYKRPART